MVMNLKRLAEIMDEELKRYDQERRDYLNMKLWRDRIMFETNRTVNYKIIQFTHADFVNVIGLPKGWVLTSIDWDPKKGRNIIIMAQEEVYSDFDSRV